MEREERGEKERGRVGMGEDEVVVGGGWDKGWRGEGGKEGGGGPGGGWRRGLKEGEEEEWGTIRGVVREGRER